MLASSDSSICWIRSLLLKQIINFRMHLSPSSHLRVLEATIAAAAKARQTSESPDTDVRHDGDIQPSLRAALARISQPGFVVESMRELVTSSDGRADADWLDHVTRLCAVPDRLANALSVRDEFPTDASRRNDGIAVDAFVAEHFFEALVIGALAAVKEQPLSFLESAAILLNRLSRRGQRDTIARPLISTLFVDSAIHNDDDDEKISQLLWAMDEEEKIRMIQTILQQLDGLIRGNNTDIKSLSAGVLCVLPADLWDDPSLEHFLLNKLWLDGVVPLSVVWIVFYSLSTIFEGLQLVHKIAFKVASQWSSAEFLEHFSSSQFEHISSVLLIAFSCLRGTMKPSSPLSQRLFNGVQNCLKSTISTKRILGMIVSECFSFWTDDAEHRLNFDQNFGKLERLRQLSRLTESDAASYFKAEHSDIDENVLLSSQKKKTDSSEKDKKEPRVADQKKKPRPAKSLWECVDYLKKRDDPDYIEAALATVVDVVRNCTDAEMSEIGLRLVNSLLHLQDEFSLANFEENKFKALEGLCCKSPAMVSKHLISQLSNRNFNVVDRYWILDILIHSARELSQASVPDWEAFFYAKELAGGQNPSGAATSSSVLAISKSGRNKFVSRRLQNARETVAKNAPTKKSVNRFYPVAHEFFFPLFDVLVDPRDVRWIFQDALLMEKSIVALGVFCYCAGNAPITRTMAGLLIEFAVNVRFSLSPGGSQRQLMFALHCIFTVIPHSILADDKSAEIIELGEWASGMMSSADSETRQWAARTVAHARDIISTRVQNLRLP